MDALVYTKNHEVALQQAPEPEPEPGEVLVAVDAVGICGSDMHAWHGHDPRRVPPLVLGHEAAGTVLTGALEGQRVVLNPLITCGACDHCVGGRSNLCEDRRLIGMKRQGAFAQRIAMPPRNLIPVPAGLGAAHAALTEPAATSLHALGLAERVSWRPLSEARALVIGAGSVGLFAALGLRMRGAGEVWVAETNPLRRQSVATEPGLRAVDPLSEALPPGAFDVVIDAVGLSVTRRAASAACRSGGVIVHIGLGEDRGGLDVRRLTLAEISFIGCYTYTPLDLRAAVEALGRGALGQLAWVEERPLDQGQAAFLDLDAGRTAAAKVILRP
ncbi:MAG: alcohol dehydrogenase catalytic domain-containing protein [Alphaproteobacteria bacterium]|nr:alcohol dehydrogenase catalytic domain-containing protein [Alphaproteobacteria bacterium]